MDTRRLSKLGGRWVVYAVGPWLLMTVAIYVWWPSMYITQPLFIPLSAYTWSGGRWTILSTQELGWPINAGYSVVLAFAAVWVGRNLTFARSLGIFVLLLLALSFAIHGLMLGLGFEYWYDSP